ncbi:DUF2905 domain-containing protein [Fulvivirgaceae bacterium BMA12]|uniref:DUF2905 domain-containing protein n=1 Tax=Agaribacillus aureus TaxID=3051825 RepID=A0ABT8LBM5_9BACT|nr:DUF2905 domain-containing protein [Fulvivirgaceae bacterium BMA12]
MEQNIGKYIIVTGAVILIIGIIFYFFHDKLQWIGRLPGDIRVEKPNFRFYFPITTMILASIVLSLLLWIFRKIF